MPIGWARVCTTSSVCGSTSLATYSTFDFDLPTRWIRVIASAAAVPSSSIEAFEMPMPVKSVITCWKFKIASVRPCEISGWYGVYAVYRAGFSKMLRNTTPWVNVL